jgi:hypothetical protein
MSSENASEAPLARPATPPSQVAGASSEGAQEFSQVPVTPFGRLNVSLRPRAPRTPAKPSRPVPAYTIKKSLVVVLPVCIRPRLVVVLKVPRTPAFKTQCLMDIIKTKKRTGIKNELRRILQKLGYYDRTPDAAAKAREAYAQVALQYHQERAHKDAARQENEYYEDIITFVWNTPVEAPMPPAPEVVVAEHPHATEEDSSPSPMAAQVGGDDDDDADLITQLEDAATTPRLAPAPAPRSLQAPISPSKNRTIPGSAGDTWTPLFEYRPSKVARPRIVAYCKWNFLVCSLLKTFLTLFVHSDRHQG